MLLKDEEKFSEDSMGRYTGPACRICRREGMKLFLKGERCYMAKCAVEVGRPPPGMHGAARKRKASDYGVQLHEKQRLRIAYGLQEYPFRNVFARAERRRGMTGEALLQLLEMRLDNIVYRLGFALSRRAARQFVRHGHVLVNGKKASIPSMVLKTGDVVGVKGDPANRARAKECAEKAAARPQTPWLNLNLENLSGEVLRVPARKEIAPEVKEQLVVELYSK